MSIAVRKILTSWTAYNADSSPELANPSSMQVQARSPVASGPSLSFHLTDGALRTKVGGHHKHSAPYMRVANRPAWSSASFPGGGVRWRDLPEMPTGAWPTAKSLSPDAFCGAFARSPKADRAAARAAENTISTRNSGLRTSGDSAWRAVCDVRSFGKQIFHHWGLRLADETNPPRKTRENAVWSGAGRSSGAARACGTNISRAGIVLKLQARARGASLALVGASSAHTHIHSHQLSCYCLISASFCPCKYVRESSQCKPRLSVPPIPQQSAADTPRCG